MEGAIQDIWWDTFRADAEKPEEYRETFTQRNKDNQLDIIHRFEMQCQYSVAQMEAHRVTLWKNILSLIRAFGANGFEG